MKTSSTHSKVQAVLNSPNTEKILQTDSQKELESIGASLNSLELGLVLTAFSQKLLSIEKLDPLLVGVSSEVFQFGLLGLSSSLLVSISGEIVTEPFWHHITCMTNTLEESHQRHAQLLEALKHRCFNIDQDELDYTFLSTIRKQIDDITYYYHDSIEFLNKILPMAWNSQRMTLIQKLSRLKTDSLFQLANEVNGGPEEASNLEIDIFTHFSQVFIKANVKDEDPAIEGLAALSIWYLHDYWSVGLLPHIADEEDLTPNLNEADKRQFTKQLFEIVEDNLAILGLNTVENLRDYSIFSRKLLKEFIQAHLVQK